jgi:uncharacterized protein YfdQ (DUF2303 family)
MARDYEHTDKHDTGMGCDVQAALAAGATLGGPQAPVQGPGAGMYAVVPKGYSLESLADFLPRPLRIEQEVVLHDADSFIGYVNEYAKESVSLIFFNGEGEEFVAILDYHEKPETPNWCDHVARFKVRRSVEFETWMNANRKQMTQVDFARFLEENLPDIAEPNSAELLEVALTFEAKKSVEFSSGVRLGNGQIQFQYDEIVRGTAQKGSIEVPEKFVLGIPIHVNGPAYRIEVRLRWRLQEGKVVFWYEIVRPHRYIEDALKEIRQRIEQETGIGVFAGVAK